MNVPKFALSFAIAAIAVAGCAGSHVPQVPQNSAMHAKPKSISPGSIEPAPMAKTAILPASVMTSQTPRNRIRKPMGSVGPLSFTQISGAASFAAAAPDGSLWVLSTQPQGSSDKYIWHYVNGTWTNISGLASRISVAPDGALLALNSGGGAYSYSNGAWSSKGGGCRDITASIDGTVYVISNAGGADGAIWQYGANGINQWVQMPGSGNRIAASPDTAGAFYVINSTGEMYYFDGTSYAQIAGAASAIAPISAGVFALAYPASASGEALYYYDASNPGWTAKNGSGVSISSDGRTLYVMSAGGGIYYAPLAITQGRLTEYPVPAPSAQPQAIAAGPDGNLWFTELWGNNVAKITTGGQITEYALPANSTPNNIVAGADGSLWFTEALPGALGHVTTGGTVSTIPIAPGNSDPLGITEGADGNIWFGKNNANQIGVVTPAGVFSAYTVPTVGAGPDALATGPDANVWFVESTANKIGKITPAGSITEYPIPTASSAPGSITAGTDGNMWFTESMTDKIAKITPAGAITEYSTGTSRAMPFGIAADAAGNLWFTQAAAGKIGEMSASGTMITEYALSSSAANPTGIVKGPDGNIWFTESGTNKIGKITP